MKVPSALFSGLKRIFGPNQTEEWGTMAELKTKPTAASVEEFISNINDDSRRHDCQVILQLMQEVTGMQPKLWGNSIVGFGSYHYRYASGREGDWFLAGFSPRKHDLTIYIMSGFERYNELLSGLGRFKTGKSCLYIKRLEDIDLDLLKQLITASVAYMKQQYFS